MCLCLAVCLSIPARAKQRRRDSLDIHQAPVHAEALVRARQSAREKRREGRGSGELWVEGIHTFGEPIRTFIRECPGRKEEGKGSWFLYRLLLCISTPSGVREYDQAEQTPRQTSSLLKEKKKRKRKHAHTTTLPKKSLKTHGQVRIQGRKIARRMTARFP